MSLLRAAAAAVVGLPVLSLASIYAFYTFLNNLPHLLQRRSSGYCWIVSVSSGITAVSETFFAFSVAELFGIGGGRDNPLTDAPIVFPWILMTLVAVNTSSIAVCLGWDRFNQGHFLDLNDDDTPQSQDH
ncbi:hypothetical protein BJ742DRAFT_779018 [Cladochytrium replicatum]|nr:hypothetical protein BJ742DRAFT_779018 [Cladochytrium replicatum]